MISMTGYGASEYQDDALQLSVEVKSYNNRYLDLSFYMPSYLSVYEADMRELVRSRVSRGHVDVNIRLRQLESEADLIVDTSLVKQYREAYRRIAAEAGLIEEIRLDHLLQADEVIKVVKRQDAHAYRDRIFTHLEQALDVFAETRLREGEKTRGDILEQLMNFEHAYEQVSQRADELESRLQQQLTAACTELLGGEYDRSRVLQEVAMLIMKYTIHEEIKRIASHLSHFRKDLESSAPVGKRLDFLCQELNREVNTIGSKSILAEVNQAVVSMKESLENIREQLRNVE